MIYSGTYDVQSIQASVRPGAIAVTCSFTIGSVASSCIVSICEVVNGNVSMMCEDLSVPRNPSTSETTEELNNLQPGVYAIVGVTVKSGVEMIPFTSGDMTFLQLQNIEVMVGPPETPTMATDFTVGKSYTPCIIMYCLYVHVVVNGFAYYYYVQVPLNHF